MSLHLGRKEFDANDERNKPTVPTVDPFERECSLSKRGIHDHWKRVGSKRKLLCRIHGRAELKASCDIEALDTYACLSDEPASMFCGYVEVILDDPE